MRFNPRIIRDEEENTGLFAGDLDERAFEESLPDGFAELAAQLSDDAAMLESRFPADAAGAANVPSQQDAKHQDAPQQDAPGKEAIRQDAPHRTSRAAWAIAAVAVASVVILATVAANFGPQHIAAPDQVAPRVADSAAHLSSPVHAAGPVKAPAVAAPKAPVTHVAFAPQRGGAATQPASGSAATPAAPSEAPGFLKDVSAPELEALYDLWEQDGPSEMKISI